MTETEITDALNDAISSLRSTINEVVFGNSSEQQIADMISKVSIELGYLSVEVSEKQGVLI